MRLRHPDPLVGRLVGCGDGCLIGSLIGCLDGCTVCHSFGRLDGYPGCPGRIFHGCLVHLRLDRVFRRSHGGLSDGLPWGFLRLSVRLVVGSFVGCLVEPVFQF